MDLHRSTHLAARPASHEKPIAKMLRAIRRAVAPFPKAQLFELRERGYVTLFEQLIACIISIRTFDEVSLPVSLRLFARAKTPKQMAKLTVGQIADLIHGSTFAHQKAERIREIARRGDPEPSIEKLTELPGVGPKCASLALGIATGEAAIGVDIHVHRVTNRWGYVRAKTPEKTLEQLRSKLPKRFWIEINELLVPFGKHICTGVKPKCSVCPVFDDCERVGVTVSR